MLKTSVVTEFIVTDNQIREKGLTLSVGQDVYDALRFWSNIIFKALYGMEWGQDDPEVELLVERDESIAGYRVYVHHPAKTATVRERDRYGYGD